MSFIDYFVCSINNINKLNIISIDFFNDFDIYIKSNNQDIIKLNDNTQVIIPINNKNHKIIFNIIEDINLYDGDIYINNIKVMNNDRIVIKTIINNIDEQYLKNHNSFDDLTQIISNFNLYNNIEDFKILYKLFLLINNNTRFMFMLKYLLKYKKFNALIYLLNNYDINKITTPLLLGGDGGLTQNCNMLYMLFNDIEYYTTDDLPYIFKIYEILNNKNCISYNTIFKSIFFNYFRYLYFKEVHLYCNKFSIDLYNNFYYFVNYYKNKEFFINYIENNGDTLYNILSVDINTFEELSSICQNEDDVKQIFKIFNKIMVILIDINKNVSDYITDNHNLLYMYLNSKLKISKKILKSLHSKNLTLQNENSETCKNISDYNILKYIKSGLLSKEEFVRLFLNKIILYSNVKYIQKYEKLLDISFNEYKYTINYNNNLINVSLLNAVACNKNEDVLLYFINKYKLIDINDNKYKLTPLHCAIYNNIENNTKILLEKSNLNLLDSENNNYLNFGINNNINLNIFELICSKQNNINIYVKNNNGLNCIMNVIKKDNKDYLNIFEKYYGLNNSIVSWIQNDYNMI